ncbi:hypothetical protein SARC_17567, partial [Sphaeroforma arctica JP610]
ESIEDLEERLCALQHTTKAETPNTTTATTTTPPHSTQATTRTCLDLDDDIDDDDEYTNRRPDVDNDEDEEMAPGLSLAWAAVVRPNVLASIVFPRSRSVGPKVSFHGSTLV